MMGKSAIEPLPGGGLFSSAQAELLRDIKFTACATTEYSVFLDINRYMFA